MEDVKHSCDTHIYTNVCVCGMSLVEFEVHTTLSFSFWTRESTPSSFKLENPLQACKSSELYKSCVWTTQIEHQQLRWVGTEVLCYNFYVRKSMNFCNFHTWPHGDPIL